MTCSHILRSKLPWVGVFTINVIVVGLANLGFVWVSVYHGSRWNLFSVQVILAIGKYYWSRNGIGWLIESLFSFVTNVQSSYLTYWASTLELYLAVFNNIVLPCFVVLVVDPDCYYNFLVPTKNVASSYVYNDYQCDNNNCLYVPVIGHTSFHPPYIYSYQCSASFTKHYATAFLYFCGVIGILVPAWELFLMLLYSTQLRKVLSASHGTLAVTTDDATISALVRVEASKQTETECIVASTDSSTNNPTDPAAAAIHRQKSAESASAASGFERSASSNVVMGNGIVGTSTSDNQSSSSKLLWRFLSSKFVPRIITPVPLILKSSSTSRTLPATTTSSYTSITKTKYFRSNQHLTTIVVLLALLFTFGTVFPLLGVATIVTLNMYCYFCQFKLARFISLSRRAGLTKRLREIDEDCRAFVIPSERWVWWVVTISCWLYAFILFDTLGDAVGPLHALWMFFVMALLPLLLYTGDGLLRQYCYGGRQGGGGDERHHSQQEEKRMDTSSNSNSIDFSTEKSSTSTVSGCSTEGLEMGSAQNKYSGHIVQ